MKIGVMSDTHDRLESLPFVVDEFIKQKVAAIVHCGDWVSPFTLEYFDQVRQELKVPVHSVYGNNEGDIARIIERNAGLKEPIHFTSKQTLELEFEGRRIVVYHGQDRVITEALIKSQLYDALFTGHTHIPRNEVQGKTLVLNPGSTSFTAKSRPIERASIAIYDTYSNTAEILYLTT
ncbi:metallophosphoesterase [Candidatus Roizmanbacteria bacterium]|nr:metallophosphoesterase [Candidatus Roizmanbacteria bacterium]